MLNIKDIITTILLSSLVIVFLIIVILVTSINQAQVSGKTSVQLMPAFPDDHLLLDYYAAKRGPQTGAPTQIIIDSIKLYAPIVEVGLTDNYAIDVPKNAFEAGWFTGSTSPGMFGSSIITAHFDTPTGQPALFYNLRSVDIGDVVQIISEDGIVTRFKIESTVSELVKAFPVELLYDNYDHEVLWLITCDGVWDPILKSYSKRLVVKATLWKPDQY